MTANGASKTHASPDEHGLSVPPVENGAGVKK